MAKHIVKCFYCGETFDANVEPNAKVRSNRYAHQSCIDNRQEQTITQEERELQDLENFIKQLFNYDTLPLFVQKQIQQFRVNKNYSYSAIHKTLYYFFIVRGNSIERSNGGIGIVPYVIDEAKKYYQAMANIQEINREKLKQGYEVQVREVHIGEPKSNLMRGYRNLFSFLDEEEELDEK